MEEFLLLGCSLIMPLIVSWLKDCDWPDWAKVLLSLGIAVLGGALTSLVEGTLDLRSMTNASAVIFTCATVFYKTWFAQTMLNSQLEQGRLRGRDHDDHDR